MRLLLPGLVLLLLLLSPGAAAQERLSNQIAVFAGLDKITGVTTTFEIPIG